MTDISKALKHISEQLCNLTFIGVRTMKEIQDFVNAQNAFNEQMDAYLVALKNDVQALNDMIAELKKSPVMSAEDQAALDAVLAHSKVVSDKLGELDAMAKPAAPAPVEPAPVEAPAEDAPVVEQPAPEAQPESAPVEDVPPSA